MGCRLGRRRELPAGPGTAQCRHGPSPSSVSTTLVCNSAVSSRLCPTTCFHPLSPTHHHHGRPVHAPRLVRRRRPLLRRWPREYSPPHHLASLLRGQRVPSDALALPASPGSANPRPSSSPVAAPASARVSPLSRTLDLTPAIANAYVTNGAKVFISGRRAEVLDAAVKLIKPQATKGGDIIA